MSALFLKIVNMSINATWLILAVLVLRLLMKKVPRWIACVLWALVAVRLVCPFSLESAFSLLPSGEVISQDIAMERKPVIYTGIPSVNNMVNPVISETFTPETGDSANPLQIVIAVVAVVWVAGVLLMLSYAFISFLLLKRRVRASIPVGEHIMVCDEVKSPFILGVFRPVIYMPSSLSGQTFELVKAHETAHIRRLDHWWKPLGFVLLAVYWFNPACWVAYILLCRDIEAACDEKVIQDKGREYAAAYSEALLTLSMPRRVIAACPLAFGETDVKRRIKGVLNYKKPAFWVILCALVGCVVVAVCFMTNPETRYYDITVKVPAGSETNTVWYSDEEVCPKGNILKLDMGDFYTGTLILQAVDGSTDIVEQTAQLKSNTPVTFQVKKGVWYRVGLRMGLNTGESDVSLKVRVRNAEVRIASEYSSAEMAAMDGEALEAAEAKLKDMLEDMRVEKEKALSSSALHGEFDEVPRPTVNLEATEGADNTQILYADKDIIIFSDYYGLFVYSKSDGAVIAGLDLIPIECNYTQGDNYCEKFVSEDGSTVYLHPLTSAGMYVYQYEADRLIAEDFRLDGLKLHTLPAGNEVYHYGNYDEWTDNGKQMVTMLYHGGTIGELCYADFEKGQENTAQYYHLFTDGVSNAIDTETAQEKKQKLLLRAYGALYAGELSEESKGPMGDSEMIGGQITSSVGQDEIPTEDGQSNFGAVGNWYTEDFGDDLIQVFIEDEWYAFQKVVYSEP